MARIRERVTKVAVKAEVTVGTAVTPGTGDYLRVIEGTGFSLNPNTIDNNEFRGGLGAGEHTTSGVRPTIQITNNARGSGVAATPPETAALLIAAGFTETVNSLIAAATASAGTTTSVTIPHGSGWPITTVAGAVIIGDPVILSGTLPAPFTGGSVVDFITDYQVSGANAVVTLASTYGATLAAGATLSRPASVSYRSASPTPHPSVTIAMYMDGLLQTFVGSRGTAGQNWTAGNKATNTFDFSGQYGARTDASMLTGETDDGTSPPIWVEGLLRIDRKAVCAAGLQWGLNADGFFPDCPENTDGIDPYEITGRRFQLTVQDRDLSLVAVEDHVADLRAGTVVPVAALLGKRVAGTTGNRMGLVVPNAKLRNVSPSVRNGMRTETLEFGSTLVDSELVLSFF